MANVDLKGGKSDVGSNEALMAERNALFELIEQARQDVGLFDLMKLVELTTSAQREVSFMTVGADSYSSAGTGSSVMR